MIAQHAHGEIVMSAPDERAFFLRFRPRPRRPGDWVVHRWRSGFGIIVALDKSNATVLWSVVPLPDDPRFNPLADPDDIHDATMSEPL